MFRENETKRSRKSTPSTYYKLDLVYNFHASAPQDPFHNQIKTSNAKNVNRQAVEFDLSR